MSKRKKKYRYQLSQQQQTVHADNSISIGNNARHTQERPRLKTIIYVAIILLAGIAVSGRTLFYTFIWDDIAFIVLNPGTQSFEKSLYFLNHGFDFQYRPLYYISIGLFNSLNHHDPLLFHLLNISTHLGSSMLLFFVFRRFFAQKLALILSLLFLVHPGLVEAVAYSSAVGELLFFFFGIAALYVSMKLDNSKAQNSLFAVIISIFLLLSLFAKESGVLWIITLPLYTLLFNKKTFVWAIGSSIIAFMAYVSLRMWVADTALIAEYSFKEIVPIQVLSLSDRLLHIPAIVIFYFKTFIFPLNLAISQDWTITARTFTSFYVPLLLFLSTLIFIGIIGIYIRRKAVSYFKVYLFFVSWLSIGLLLHAQIIPLTMTVAERWLYFPIVGMIGVVGVISSQVLDKQPTYKLPLYIVLCVVLVGFSTRSYFRVNDWKDEATLIIHDSKFNKNSYSLENLIGLVYLHKTDYEKAREHFENSINLAPKWWMHYSNYALLEARAGNYKKARTLYMNALANFPYSLAYEQYAELLLFERDIDLAIAVAEEGLNYYPDDATLWMTHARAYYTKGDKDRALRSAKKAYELEPTEITRKLVEAISK